VHFDHVLRILRHERLRAHIADDPHNLREIVSAPQDGIAAPAATHRNADRLATLESSQQRIEVSALDFRHVAKKDERSIAVSRQRFEPGSERCTQALRVIGVVHDFHFQAVQSLSNALRREARDHNNGVSAAAQGSDRRMCDDWLAFDELEQLVARRHTRGAPCGKHDCGNL
jgi:hypothetical protein